MTSLPSDQPPQADPADVTDPPVEHRPRSVGKRLAALTVIGSMVGFLAWWNFFANRVIEPGDIIWTFQTGGYVNSSPAIGNDGTIYVGSEDRHLYALDGKTGKTKWKYQTGSDVSGSPAIGPDPVMETSMPSTGPRALPGGPLKPRAILLPRLPLPGTAPSTSARWTRRSMRSPVIPGRNSGTLKPAGKSTHHLPSG